MIKMWTDLLRGLWGEHPIFRLVLGMCPALAVTNTAINGMTMGLATTFVLVTSGTIISLLKHFIPQKVRIPSYIVIIATFVTAADYTLNAFWHDIHGVLGLFVPLIIVNCLILGRAEAFSSKNTVKRTIFDSLGYGIGFTWGLVLLGVIREVLGFGSIFGMQVMPDTFYNWTIMVLPSGAFLTLGVLLGLYNMLIQRAESKNKVLHTVKTASEGAFTDESVY